jgi:hypothetical protein
LRGRLRKCLTNGRKSARTEQLLGCSFTELVIHLQRQFVPPMSWAAFLRGEIHIDHIVPCSRFDLSQAEQQRACFHFSNLQPLWAVDNLRKHARISWQSSSEVKDLVVPQHETTMPLVNGNR